MGKRKERRLAAKIAANRRVKLDIFADPSGDTAGTSAHEAGGGTDQEHRAVVPTSPSSSGQGKENPLLLLGQYSDDELDEESSKRPKAEANGSSSDVLDLDTEEPAEHCGGPESDIDDDQQLSEQVDTVKNVDNHNGKEDGSTYETAEDGETDPVMQVNEPEPSGIQVNGDLTGGWKMVMHEESNQYYYWNTVTGQTSWEVPAVLAGLAVSGGEGNVSLIDAHLNSESAMDAYASAVDGLGGSHMSSAEAIQCNSSLEIKNENGELAYVCYDASQALTHYGDSASSISYANPSVLSNCGSLLQASAFSMGQMTDPVIEDRSSNDEEDKDKDKDKHIKNSTECYETADVHSSHLVKCCESLLQRLEVLDRSGVRLEGHEWITKEIEVRLSDCKALSPYGSALLPFWWHTEGQLKRLESAVGEGEASLIVQDKHNDKLEAIQNSPLREECSLQCIETGSEILENEKGTSSININCPSPIPEASMSHIKATSQIPDIDNSKTGELSSACHELLGSEQEPDSFPETKPNITFVVPIGESHNDEDVDMDVEMEVDEELVNPLTIDSPSTLENVGQSNQPVTEYPLLPTDELGVPPPPDEEWIPPPPPDDEPIPPPPPEEPLPSVPLAYPDALTCPPYPDQYNNGYAALAYDYCSSVAGSTGCNYYAQADGSQINEPQPPPYFNPAGTSALREVAVDVNLVEAAAYYDISSGAIPSAPVVSSVVSSGYYVEAGPFSYGGGVLTSDHGGPIGYTMETGNLPKVIPKLEASSTVTVPLAGNLQASFVAAGTQSGGSAVSNGSVLDPLPASSSNNQTKAVRRKKHTVAVAPSMRSNKKVSSLVDKWKAAKEELHSEEEEEPETALQLLEKKRQKEIEEWRARQIASGEAQDNANFLPLGGDWRERVKRKRAKAKTEAAQTPTDAVDSENQQRDLVELSKDLPSGWQAFWDESSKGVYYGNSITSETTWTRPTR